MSFYNSYYLTFLLLVVVVVLKTLLLPISFSFVVGIKKSRELNKIPAGQSLFFSSRLRLRIVDILYTHTCLARNTTAETERNTSLSEDCVSVCSLKIRDRFSGGKGREFYQGGGSLDLVGSVAPLKDRHWDFSSAAGHCTSVVLVSDSTDRQGSA